MIKLLIVTLLQVITLESGTNNYPLNLLIETPTPEPARMDMEPGDLNISIDSKVIFTIETDGTFGCKVPEKECRAGLVKFLKEYGF